MQKDCNFFLRCYDFKKTTAVEFEMRESNSSGKRVFIATNVERKNV